MLKPRVLKVIITLQDAGKKVEIEGLRISVKCDKYSNEISNNATISIDNIAKPLRDKLASNGTPFARQREQKLNTIEVLAGRGDKLSSVYVGDIWFVTPGQPPDFLTVIEAKTASFDKTLITATEEPPTSTIQNISKRVADTLGLNLQNEADQTEIINYQYVGSSIDEVENINRLGMVDAYIDDKTLVIKNKNKPLSMESILINKDTGMIGVPEFTDFGVKVRVLFERAYKIGQSMKLESIIYPATNGTYTIFKIDYDLNNRDNAWYALIEANGALL